MSNKFKSVLRKVSKKIFGNTEEEISDLMPSVKVFQGIEKSNSNEITIGYVGNDIQYENYILELTFSSEPKILFNKKQPLENVSEMLKSNFENLSLIYFESDRVELEEFWKGKKGIKFPRWIECTMDISDSFENLCKKKAFKNFIRKINQNNYETEYSNSDENRDDFYYNFYKPYLAKNYGATAYFIAYNYFNSMKDHTELLLLKKEGVTVGMVLIEYLEEFAHFAYMGFKDGDETYVREGATSGLYFYSIQRAQEKGFKYFCFGPSKSFLKDGVLRFKVEKSCFIADKTFTPDENIFLEFVKETEASKNFLVANPFVFYPIERKREIIIFVPSSDNFSVENAVKMIKSYKLDEGIENWNLVFWENPILKDEDFKDTKYENRVKIRNLQEVLS
ncbi:MAG: hypothetical protein DWQ06_09620 [Calditrichaeota bacterium]|nr:MAG: hypothetical protein DWQ06_09620 [Calditrichota bacterium]